MTNVWTQAGDRRREKRLSRPVRTARKPRLLSDGEREGDGEEERYSVPSNWKPLAELYYVQGSTAL